LQERRKGLLGSTFGLKKLKAQNFNLHLTNIEMIGSTKRLSSLYYGFDKSNMAAKINEYTGKRLVFTKEAIPIVLQI
jgi:hypothetical protein